VVLYDFYCPECGEERIVKNPIDQDFPLLLCEKCNVALKQRLPFLKPLACTSSHAVQERCEQEAMNDLKQISRGNENKLSDLVGDKLNPFKKGG